MSETNTTTTRPWPQSLLDLLERQQGLVNQLVGLAESQAGLIVDRRTDRLLDLLSRRQTLIDAFTAGQHELTELTRGLNERLRTVSSAQRDRIKCLIDEIGHRLSLVMRRDEQDQGLLRTSRDEIKQELVNTGEVSQARAAYLHQRTKSNCFADQRG